MSEAPGIVGGSGSFLGASGGSALGAFGALGAGAGLAYLLGTGPSPLPSQFGTVQGYAPGQVATGQQLVGYGTGLEQLGAKGIADAQAGKLTPEQQAALDQTKRTQENQARQMYYAMGRTPDKDTSFLETTQGIDAKMLAAAQSFVATNIQLAVGSLSAGASFIGEGLQFEQAASSNMIAAGNAQIQLDKDYSDSISAAFGAIGKAFGAVAPMMAMSDERLKRNIFPVGELENGVGVYTFRYRWDDTLYLGVVAQDVAEVMPDAVMEGPGGYLLVDYAQLSDKPILWY